MSATIRLTDVTRTFRLGARRVKALRGVSFELDEPGFYSIMGPSGSGKSTLLHLLAALDRPDGGTIEVAGKRIDSLNDRQLTVFRRRQIGIVFQQFNLIPTLTALANVELPAMLDGMPRSQRRQRAAKLLELLNLSDRASHRPDALSGGEQQRVAIARALFFEPDLLLADEPTGSLDSTTSGQIWKLMSELASQQGITVLMVTHEPAAVAHCRRVFLLRDGRIDDSFDVGDLDAAQLASRIQQPVG